MFSNKCRKLYTKIKHKIFKLRKKKNLFIQKKKKKKRTKSWIRCGTGSPESIFGRSSIKKIKTIINDSK
jgi:hypothetical protein